MHRSNLGRRASTATIVIDYPWTKTKEDVAAFYNVEENKGLSEERVKRDLERYGPNGILKNNNNNNYILSFFPHRTTCRRRQTIVETHLRTI